MKYPIKLRGNFGRPYIAACLLGILSTTLVVADEPNGKAKHSNRLSKETSPYLLMHAHNPVDWYPWGAEALEKAKKEGKLIFLSVGYSSCHWCHVMERESFHDEDIARAMNKHFVCIKVDREERPDIDAIYMMALQVFHQMSGSNAGGGWPLSMFLTPDGKPFFGGTYFPARDGDRPGVTGFLSILSRVEEFWTKQPDAIRQNAAAITHATKTALEGQQSDAVEKLDEKLLADTLAALEEQYDPTYGGFGYRESNPGQPKFPEPSNLLFLVEHVKRTKNERAREMLLATLDRMSMGGIWDHLGGGFHRYSVDRFWKIPHFEKMLYDNAQLATIYTEAHLLTGHTGYRRVVDRLLEFVIREMTTEDGGFYAAIDADSEGEEGRFYRWKKQQIESLLTKNEYALFASVYGLDAEPNFEEHYYAPQLTKLLSEHAAEINMSENELEAQLATIRKKLFDTRSQRIRPLIDSKILTSWNGLMIRGFADAGRGLKNERYVHAASRAATFVLDNLQTDDGRLMRTYSGGKAKLNAYLTDYASLIDGLIALYQATDDKTWLQKADQLMVQQMELFWDEKDGGFFFTSDDHETLLARAKSPSDGARPSGNSVSACNLIFLSKHLDKPDYRVKAKKSVQSIGTLLRRAPSAAPRMMIAVSRLLE